MQCRWCHLMDDRDYCPLTVLEGLDQGGYGRAHEDEKYMQVWKTSYYFQLI